MESIDLGTLIRMVPMQPIVRPDIPEQECLLHVGNGVDQAHSLPHWGPPTRLPLIVFLSLLLYSLFSCSRVGMKERPILVQLSCYLYLTILNQMLAQLLSRETTLLVELRGCAEALRVVMPPPLVSPPSGNLLP